MRPRCSRLLRCISTLETRERRLLTRIQWTPAVCRFVAGSRALAALRASLDRLEPAGANIRRAIAMVRRAFRVRRTVSILRRPVARWAARRSGRNTLPALVASRLGDDTTCRVRRAVLVVAPAVPWGVGCTATVASIPSGCDHVAIRQGNARGLSCLGALSALRTYVPRCLPCQRARHARISTVTRVALPSGVCRACTPLGLPSGSSCRTTDPVGGSCRRRRRTMPTLRAYVLREFVRQPAAAARIAEAILVVLLPCRISVTATEACVPVTSPALRQARGRGVRGAPTTHTADLP